jgi:tripartite ATP-independent transporter DctP family solute receptor
MKQDISRKGGVLATKWNQVFFLLAILLIFSLGFFFTWRYFYLGNDVKQNVDQRLAAKLPRYSLSLGLNLSADSALYAAAQRFALQVAENSGGRVEIRLYPDQKLGTDEQMLEMAREGKLDLLLTPTAKLSSDVPAMQYADLPFYFRDRAELYAMLDGEPGNLLLAKLNDIDLVGIAFWENGFKQFTANRAIQRPEDFAGLRIRTMKSRLLMDQFSAMGAEPVVIDFATLRQALAEGAVEGQENPLVAIVGKRLYEVQQHLTLSNHAWLGYVFSASRNSFEGLPQDVRNLIINTAKELAAWEREETARRETQFLETIRAAGVQIHTLTEQEHRHFSETLAPLVRGYGFEIGYDLLAKTDELRTLKLLTEAKQSPKNDLPPFWLMGLDADLSGGGAIAGGAIWRGMDMAVDEINAKGGILGRPLRIIARDHRMNSQRGLENIKTFAALPGMLATFGGMHTGIVMDELETIHRLQMPVLIAWCAGSGIIHHHYQPSYTFRVSIDDSWAAPFLLEHALRRGHRIALLLEHSAWGRSNENALKSQISKLPPGTVTLEWLNKGETNFVSRLQNLQSRGIEVLLLVANAPESFALIKEMAKLPKPMPIYAHWGLTGGDFWRQSHKALEKVDLRFVQPMLLKNGKSNSRIDAFVERYRTRYRLDALAPIPAPASTVQAYDLVQLLARATTQAGSGEHSKIRLALETLKKPYAGVIRDYAPPFTPDRHDALEPNRLFLARYDSKGHIVGIR